MPFGSYARIAYVRDFSPYKPVLSRWEFSSLDFEALHLKPDDFVYADPPYDVPFTQYARKQFSWDDQVRAANGSRGIRARSCFRTRRHRASSRSTRSWVQAALPVGAAPDQLHRRPHAGT